MIWEGLSPGESTPALARFGCALCFLARFGCALCFSLSVAGTIVGWQYGLADSCDTAAAFPLSPGGTQPCHSHVPREAARTRTWGSAGDQALAASWVVPLKRARENGLEGVFLRGRKSGALVPNARPLFQATTVYYEVHTHISWQDPELQFCLLGMPAALCQASSPGHLLGITSCRSAEAEQESGFLLPPHLSFLLDFSAWHTALLSSFYKMSILPRQPIMPRR